MSLGPGGSPADPRVDVVVRPADSDQPDEDGLAHRLARHGEWYGRSPILNPYLLEAYKTIAFELFESGRVPDTVLFAEGWGLLGGGLRKGFRDLHELGWIDAVPRLLAVRPEGGSSGQGHAGAGLACLARGGPDASLRVSRETLEDMRGPPQGAGLIPRAALRERPRGLHSAGEVVVIARGHGGVPVGSGGTAGPG